MLKNKKEQIIDEILNEILEKKKEVKEELETISLMNMNLGKDVKLVKLRSHLKKSLEKAIQLTSKKMFEDIETLGVYTYLTGTNERRFNFNPSEKVWKELKKRYGVVK